MVHVVDTDHEVSVQVNASDSSGAEDNEHIPATFVYAGINVEREGLFTGVRGKQIASRCVMKHTGNFPYHAEWHSMVAVMEMALRLHHHEPGTLAKQAKYLHQRTGGSISSLSHLIRAAAISAIADGTERVTRRLLESIPVDHNTQSDTPRPAHDEDDGLGETA